MVEEEEEGASYCLAFMADKKKGLRDTAGSREGFLGVGNTRS